MKVDDFKNNDKITIRLDGKTSLKLNSLASELEISRTAVVKILINNAEKKDFIKKGLQ